MRVRMRACVYFLGFCGTSVTSLSSFSLLHREIKGRPAIPAYRICSASSADRLHLLREQWSEIALDLGFPAARRVTDADPRNGTFGPDGP